MKFVEIDKPFDDVVAEIKERTWGRIQAIQWQLPILEVRYGKCKNRKRFGRMASIHGLLEVYQDYYAPDNDDAWWQEVMKAGEKLINKYKGMEIEERARQLVLSHFAWLEITYRKGKNVGTKIV